MNKIVKILNDTIKRDQEKVSIIGYVKSYPEKSVTIGEIVFSKLFSNNTDSYYRAAPLYSKSFTFPVIGQLVLILDIDGFYYYTGQFQFSKQQNAEFLLEYFDERNSGVIGAKEDFDNVTKEIFPTSIKVEQVDKRVGETFLTGNFNNDIILGYDKNNNAKLSIIQNREDSTYDLNTSGFHIRTDQKITDEITYPNDKDIEDSELKFILITEDVLNFVSKLGDIILSSNDKIIINSKENVIINTDKTASLKASKSIEIKSNEIYIGEDANEAVVLGDKLETLLNDIISNIDNTYTHLNSLITALNSLAGGALSPIQTQVIAQQTQLNSVLKSKVQQIKSQIAKVK